MNKRIITNNCEVEKHRLSLSEFQEKKRWMELVLWETEVEFHGKCSYKNGWSKEKQLNSVRESIAGWEKKIQEEEDWLICNDMQQGNQIIKFTFNYNNWTKEQFITEINRLKTEIESLKNNQTLTSSERQEILQHNQQKLEELEKSYSPVEPNNNLSTNLIIGGTVLTLIGLFLFIRKSTKIKKRSK